MRKSKSERLSELESQISELKARADAVRAQVRADDRKRDTRRKIVLGAALLDRAQRDPAAARLLAQIVGELTRPADRAAFENYALPEAPPVTINIPRPAGIGHRAVFTDQE